MEAYNFAKICVSFKFFTKVEEEHSCEETHLNMFINALEGDYFHSCRVGAVIWKLEVKVKD